MLETSCKHRWLNPAAVAAQPSDYTAGKHKTTSHDCYYQAVYDKQKQNIQLSNTEQFVIIIVNLMHKTR